MSLRQIKRNGDRFAKVTTFERILQLTMGCAASAQTEESYYESGM
jgi:hypothetical protein